MYGQGTQTMERKDHVAVWDTTQRPQRNILGCLFAVGYFFLSFFALLRTKATGSMVSIVSTVLSNSFGLNRAHSAEMSKANNTVERLRARRPTTQIMIEMAAQRGSWAKAHEMRMHRQAERALFNIH